MPNITMQSTVLRSCERNAKSGKAAFTASLTKHVCKAMEWNENVPDCLKSAKPEGEIVASSVELVPDQKEMIKFAVSLGVSQVDGFEIVRRELEDSRGKGHRLELRFNVSFQDEDGCARLERYLLTCGAAKGKLNISYTRQPKQDSLISDQQAADTAKED